MNKNKTLLLTLGLIILVVASSLIFFGIGNQEKNGIQIASFIFIIIDELIVYGVILLLTNKEKNTFSIAGLSSLTAIYVLASLIINILLKYIFLSLRVFLVCNFIALLLYVFIAILILIAKKEAN